MTERRQHFEVWSAGIDEALQTIGGDPQSGQSSTGLRVPFLATPDLDSRYLFMLCGFQLAENVKARICGLRQFASLGVEYTTETGLALAEQEIVSPNFRLPDGNISWHLLQFSPLLLDKYRLGNGPFDQTNFVETMSEYPALLYNAAGTAIDPSGYYVKLTSYAPPNKGRPIGGEPLGHLGTFHDLRWNWRSSHAWNSIDIPVEGPGFFAFMASVRQSTGAYPLPLSGTSPELAFVKDYGITVPTSGTTGVLIWRVAGSMIVKIEEGESLQ